ncbi:MAG: DMT family transporter [Sulfurospirillaceae bacterium]|nr:DMT family transporter [Sulfurospirillaceae bacterium]MDD2827832.1 DMT family transporter [Sulfurospirillaceae bacterium]
MQAAYSKALLFTVIGVFLMSFESWLIRIANVSAQTVTFYFGLFMFSATFLALLSIEKSHIFNVYTKNPKPIILSALFMGTSNLFFVLAIKHTTVANAVFILSSAPMVSSLIGYVLFRRKTPRRIFVATFFVFIGLFMILSDGLGMGRWEGNLYALLCVISFSSLFAVLENYKKVSRLACIGGGGLFASFLAFTTATIVIPDTHSFLVILFMGGILTPISRVLIGAGTKVLASVDVTLLTLIETVLAPIWVWLFLNEVPASSTLYGGAIIIVTLVINSLQAHRSYTNYP